MQKHSIQKKRRFSKIWLLLAFAGIALSSFVLLVIFWFTSVFQNAILAGLELRNGTATFAWWERPPVRAVYRIRVFNYTNVEEFESGQDKKLRVQEVGPYIYRETLMRVNVKLNENGTVSYQEKRSFQWEGGSPDDEMIVVPNVPLLTAVAFSRDINFMAQVTLTAILSTMQAKTFINIPAGGFLWGYDDHIFQMAKSVMTSQQVPFDKFGMLVPKVGLSKDRITIHTGSGDLNNLGTYQRLNGMKRHNIWGDEKCDRIDGTDGSMFPPRLFQDPNATLNIYARDMCRTFPLRFQGYGNAYGIPTLRYKPPIDVFTSSRTKDSCFCTKISTGPVFTARTCPPAGIFNASHCNFGVPTLASFPHFYLGDKSLLKEVDGLNPQEKLHECYVDLHPRLGVPIAGWSRFQINVEARKAVGVPFLGNLKDGAILPLLWLEVGIDNLPEPVMNILQHAYFTAAAVETTLQWGSLIGFVFSICAILFILRKDRIRSRPILQRNISGEDRLLE